MCVGQGALLASLQEQVVALEAKSQQMLGLSADAKAKAKEEKLAAQLAREVATKERSEASQARILAVVDAYADHANFAYERGFRGCGLLNAAAELLPGDPGRAAVRPRL